MSRRPHRALDPANFTISIIILLLVGVAGGLGTEIIKGTKEGAIWSGLAIVLLLVTALGVVLSERIQRWMRWNRRFQRIGITKQVTRAQALIVFVSKGAGRSSARDAAFYHAEGEVLRHLWLLTSSEAEEEAAWVRGQVGARYPAVTVYPTVCLPDVYSIPDAKEEVERIRKAILRKELDDREVMCDFTGMTKHMSAGMIFACAPKEARLQFMHPKRFLADGRADPEAGASEPVEVEIAYQIEEDDEE
jgi:hypothetical protein